MNLNCPLCRTINAPGALFYQNCGNAFAVKPIRKNSVAVPLLIIGAILVVCGFCGLSGLIGNRNRTETIQTTNVNAKPLVGTTSPEKKTVEGNITASDPSDNGDNDERMATVISENVNLRKEGSAKSKVIETLPKDSTVEVVKQSGAWFYVRAIGGQSG
jgi:membrane-bound ClpP family serine protease